MTLSKFSAENFGCVSRTRSMEEIEVWYPKLLLHFLNCLQSPGGPSRARGFWALCKNPMSLAHSSPRVAGAFDEGSFVAGVDEVSFH